jgi:hypothetical protein
LIGVDDEFRQILALYPKLHAGALLLQSPNGVAPETNCDAFEMSDDD